MWILLVMFQISCVGVIHTDFLWFSRSLASSCSTLNLLGYPQIHCVVLVKTESSWFLVGLPDPLEVLGSLGCLSYLLGIFQMSLNLALIAVRLIPTTILSFEPWAKTPQEFAPNTLWCMPLICIISWEFLLVPSSIFLSWSYSKSYHFGPNPWTSQSNHFWHPWAAAQPIWSAQNNFWCKAPFSAWLNPPKPCASKVFFSCGSGTWHQISRPSAGVLEAIALEVYAHPSIFSRVDIRS